MAVPGESREGTFCGKCFTHLSASETYCPECGAPTGEAAPAGESAVHGELAQANLLRLRGDHAGSEKALLAILRRYPNDPHAHEMLGDVCVESGEFERAAEWYELALDLAPNSPEIRRKLQETRERLDDRDVADTAETLGLPSAKSNLAWWPLAASGALVVLAVLIVAWPRQSAPATLRASATAPLEAVAAPVPTPAPTPNTVVPTPVPEPSGTVEDRKLLAELQAKAGAIRVQTVTLDPRTQTLLVGFEVPEKDDPRELATVLGREALVVAPTAMTTTLRAVRSGRLVFAADLVRATMESAEPLTNVWPTTEPTMPVVTVPATGTPPTGEPPAATTG